MSELDEILFGLSTIVEKTSTDSKLSANEKALLEKCAAEFLKDYAKKRNIRTTGNTVQKILASASGYGASYLRQQYGDIEKCADEIFKYQYDKKKRYISDEHKAKLALYRTVMDHYGTSVDLDTLMRETLSQYKSAAEVDSLLANPFARKEFYDGLNGIIGSGRVAKVDTHNLGFKSGESGTPSISDISKISIQTSTKENPIFFIKSHVGVDTIDFAPSLDYTGQITIITISDLHLEGNENPITSLAATSNGGARFLERIEAFAEFEKKLVEQMNSSGTKVDGVVFVGDVFEGYSKNVSGFNLNHRSLVKQGIIDKKNDGVSFVLTGSETVKGVCFLSGNHDVTLGQQLFEDAVREICPDGKFLGNEHVKVNLGKSVMEFSHPTSWDFGVQRKPFKRYEDIFALRTQFNSECIHYEEYLSICNVVYNSFSDEEKGKFDNRHEIFAAINGVLKKENPELYSYLEPFIVPRSELENEHDFDVSYYSDGSNHYYDSVFAEYTSFSLTDGFSRLFKTKPDENDVGKAFVESERMQKILGGRNPIVTNETMDDVVLSSVGHFHEQLTTGHKVVHTKADDFHVEVVEPQAQRDYSSGRKNDFIATKYTIDLSQGFVSKMKVEPMSFRIQKIDGNFRVSQFRNGSFEYEREIDDAFIEEHAGKSR